MQNPRSFLSVNSKLGLWGCEATPGRRQTAFLSLLLATMVLPQGKGRKGAKKGADNATESIPGRPANNWPPGWRCTKNWVRLYGVQSIVVIIEASYMSEFARDFMPTNTSYMREFLHPKTCPTSYLYPCDRRTCYNPLYARLFKDYYYHQEFNKV